ncbi:MAG: PASTA domain-containing protein, partial [Propionibacteriaceae bacterium]|nr:PASTA domain-containing protein [Propionibacteriaceae bacterium]
LASAADLAEVMGTAVLIHTDYNAPVTPSAAPTNVSPAPAQVERVWRPKEATARTPRSSTSPPVRSAATPIFPVHVSQDPVHKRRRGIVLLAAVVACAMLTGFGSWWFLSGRYTTVPAAMLNVSQTDAQAAAEASGLRAIFEQEYSETVPAGSVTRTDPVSGERIVRGSTVTAWISLGPERYEMPPVVGLPADDAKTAINKANLAVGEVTEEWSETVAAGLVVSSSEDKGAKLKKATPVSLVVSKGPKPIAIEDFSGRDADEAKEKLTAAGFSVSEDSEHHKEVAKGKVISQTPSSGEGKKGDEIKLVVSKGPVMVEVPAVRYLSRSDAKSKLEASGFKVDVRETGGPFRLGIAAGTTPGAGKSAPEGSTIVLHVS